MRLVEVVGPGVDEPSLDVGEDGDVIAVDGAIGRPLELVEADQLDGDAAELDGRPSGRAPGRRVRRRRGRASRRAARSGSGETARRRPGSSRVGGGGQVVGAPPTVQHVPAFEDLQRLAAAADLAIAVQLVVPDDAPPELVDAQLALEPAHRLDGLPRQQRAACLGALSTIAATGEPVVLVGAVAGALQGVPDRPYDETVDVVVAPAAVLRFTDRLLFNANGPEKRAIARAAGFPARCIDARISTINPRWASAFLRRCNLGNGSAVYRRGSDGAGWVNVYMGPDDKAPRRYGVPHVPTRTARDLRLCR